MISQVVETEGKEEAFNLQTTEVRETCLNSNLIKYENKVITKWTPPQI